MIFFSRIDALPDFGKRTCAYGHSVTQIEKIPDVKPTLKKTLHLKDRTVFFNFQTDPTENVRSMARASQDITEMPLATLAKLFAFQPFWMASARKHNKFACYLHFDRMTRHSPASRRYIELAIGHLPALQTDLHHAQPLEQRHVLVMSQAHPAAPEELTFQILTNLKFVLVEYERNDSLVFERALVDRGAPARIKLSLPQFMSAAHFVSRSDSIWLALTTIATSVVESYPLTPMESSCAIENSSICISWHNGYRNDSARK